MALTKPVLSGVADTRGYQACTLRGTENFFLSGEADTLTWWRGWSVSVTLCPTLIMNNFPEETP